MKPEKTQYLRLRTAPAFMEKIDDWRRKQSPIPSISQAVRILVEAGLKNPPKKAA